MGKRCLIEKIAFGVFVVLTVIFTICMALNLLSIGQIIALMICYILIIVYNIFGKAITFARNQSEVENMQDEYEDIKAVHRKRYRAMLNGDNELSDKLAKEVEEMCQEFEYDCYNLLQCQSMDHDQKRELRDLINMAERLRKDVYVP